MKLCTIDFMPIAAKQVMYRLSTNESIRCPICQFTTYGGDTLAFDDVCNHIIKEHKLHCLHVGQETSRNNDGHPWHSTVAIFGK